MPRKSAANDESAKPEMEELLPENKELGSNDDEVANLSRMLSSVLKYLSDDDIEEIDIQSLLENTEGLQAWWDQYRESNRIHIEEEIKKSLGDLSLEDLESIREKIMEKQ
ncbi:hypothetical protein HHO41_11720 [Bacillus sp. DNRA2]|uniref:hypothetical protein n=1 Tax=Bacillus sp. DNRA2 TaxID=2723053 RepID=UPI00145D56CE|nr:hypothetical protein [Bacillus sp. DNRA2]NMD70963.1 hypothetical protein [Bacillus sp. DNRA2]